MDLEDRIYAPGERVGRYEICSHLASGGFSALYSARPLGGSAEPRVALKVCRHDARSLTEALREQYNDRLVRELELLQALQHPNIVRVHERHAHEGLVFYAMDLLEGPTLARWMVEERRTYRDLLRVFGELAEALARVHGQGVVHRDVKPSNVVLVKTGGEQSELRPVLIDFGIAQGVGRAPVTLPGSLVGTAEVTTPEYAKKVLERRLGKPHRAAPPEDVFQMGVLLYRMLTGRLPTSTAPEQLLELLAEIQVVKPPHVLDLNPEAPPAFAELAMSCLAKDGSKRPRDGEALVERIQKAWELDQARIDGEAPRASSAYESRLSENVELTTSRWGVGGKRKKPSREAKELKRARRELRRAVEAMNSARAFVLVTVALLIVVFALGVAFVPAVWPGQHHGMVLSTTGLKMPDTPDPQWLRPTKGKCLLRGAELKGLTIIRDVCWNTAVKAKHADPCPETFYDAPPEAPPQQKDWCFQPYVLSTVNQSLTPVPSAQPPAQDAGGR